MCSDSNFYKIYPCTDCLGFQDITVSLTRKESFKDLVQVVGIGFESKNVCGLEVLCFPKDDGGIILLSPLENIGRRGVFLVEFEYSVCNIRVPARKVANNWPLLRPYSN